MQTQPFLMPGTTAIEHVLNNAGTLVARNNDAWKRTHKAIYLVPGSEFQVSRPPLNVIYPEGTNIKYRPHIDAVFADGTCGVWTPTQDDLMAHDWFECDHNGHPV